MRDGMLLCRPRHAPYPLARLAFSRRVKLRISRWSAGHRLMDFCEDRWDIFLIIPQGTSNRVRQRGIFLQVQKTYFGHQRIQGFPDSDPSQPDPGHKPATCNLQDREFGSVPLVLFSSATPHAYPQDPNWTTRPKSQKPQSLVHPLIRFDHPSSTLTGPPSPHLQSDPQTTTPSRTVALAHTFERKN
jgi:hypothetical protein